MKHQTKPCGYTETCLFFLDLLKDMPNGSTIFKRTYCQVGNPRCARLMVMQQLGRENVPLTLFPNQYEEALELLKKAGIAEPGCLEDKE